MARPTRTTYRVLTLIPSESAAGVRLLSKPALPGELGDSVTKIRRRGEGDAVPIVALLRRPRLQAC